MIGKRIIIVCAHPDDAEIAMGMRIASLTQSGALVDIYCFSHGNESYMGLVRQEESRKAGGILGVHKYEFANYPDGNFSACADTIRRDLIEIMHEGHYDMGYCHWFLDNHADHVVLSEQFCFAALRELSSFALFESAYSIKFEPNEYFVTGPDLLEKKCQALRQFSSQQQIPLESLIRSRAENSFYLIHPNVSKDVVNGYCERFSIQRSIIIEEGR